MKTIIKTIVTFLMLMAILFGLGCAETNADNDEEPLPTCEEDEVLVEGACIPTKKPSPTCADGEVLEGDKCVTPPPTCLDGEVLEGDKCVTPPPTCPDGEVLEGDKCVTPSPTCPDGEVLDGEKCITPPPTCPDEQVFNGVECITPTPICPDGQVFNGVECITPTPICADGEVLEGDKCVTPPPICLDGQILEGGECVTPNTCPEGKIFNGQECVSPPTCLEGQIFDGQECVTTPPTCLEGQILEGGECVTAPPICVGQEVLEGMTCVLKPDPVIRFFSKKNSKNLDYAKFDRSSSTFTIFYGDFLNQSTENILEIGGFHLNKSGTRDLTKGLLFFRKQSVSEDDFSISASSHLTHLLEIDQTSVVSDTSNQKFDLSSTVTLGIIENESGNTKLILHCKQSGGQIESFASAYRITTSQILPSSKLDCYLIKVSTNDLKQNNYVKQSIQIAGLISTDDTKKIC